MPRLVKGISRREVIQACLIHKIMGWGAESLHQAQKFSNKEEEIMGLAEKLWMGLLKSSIVRAVVFYW